MRSNPSRRLSRAGRLTIALLSLTLMWGVQAQTYQLKQWVVDLKPTYSVTARWAPVSVDMGVVSLNQTVQQTVALFNDGNITANFSTLSGSGSGIALDAAQCAAVAPAASCAVTLTFSPTTTGAVSVSNVRPVAVGTVPLQYANALSAAGIGAQGHGSLSATSLTYPNQTLGTTSTKQTVTLVNDGTAPLSFSDIHVDTGASDFGQSNTCASVAVNASCTIDVTFTPVALGMRSGSITLTGNGGAVASISLSGAGQSPTYAAWSTTDKSTNITVSGNGLTATAAGGNWWGIRATRGMASGKWYWELTVQSADGAAMLGIADASASTTALMHNFPNSSFYYLEANSNQGTWPGLVKANPPASVLASVGTVYMFALDMNAGTLYMGRNGGWFNNGVPTSGAAKTGAYVSGLSGTVYPAASLLYTSDSANFGASAFKYAVPAGYNPGVY